MRSWGPAPLHLRVAELPEPCCPVPMAQCIQGYAGGWAGSGGLKSVPQIAGAPT